jgi:hypothetical protein
VSPGRIRVEEAGQPLRAWSAAEKERLWKVASGASARWCAAWGLEPRDVRSSAARPAGGAEAVRTPFDPGATELGLAAPIWREAGAGIWWSFSSNAPAPTRRVPGAEEPPHLAAIAAALFDERVTPWSSARAGEPGAAAEGSSIAEATASAAWADLWFRLDEAWRCGSAGLGSPARVVPPGAWATWSGALLLSVPLLDGILRLLLTGDRVEEALRPSGGAPSPAVQGAPLRPAWSAAAGRRVTLCVTMQPFELELGSLAGLRVGDILQTDHPLHAPLAVAMADGGGDGAAPICTAYLGCAGPNRAAELRSTASHNHEPR